MPSANAPRRPIYRFYANGKLSISGVPRRFCTCCTRLRRCAFTTTFEDPVYCKPANRCCGAAWKRVSGHLLTSLPVRAAALYAEQLIDNVAHAYALNFRVFASHWHRARDYDRAAKSRRDIPERTLSTNSVYVNRVIARISTRIYSRRAHVLHRRGTKNNATE